MAQVDVSELDDADANAVEVLSQLPAQVSSKGEALTAKRVHTVLRTPSTSVLVARLDVASAACALSRKKAAAQDSAGLGRVTRVGVWPVVGGLRG
jgi:hypothetical protein